MSEHTGTSLMDHLKKVPDPRVKRSRRHELMDILVIALRATMGGADDWVEVVQFGQAKQEWFATFLELPNGIASHDTFGRVFQILDSKVLEQVCIDWLQGIAGKVQGVVAIDGKSLRGSRDADRSPLHIVSAWACANSMLLGQVQTDKKSNEITAIPALLRLLSIEGCIVTIDAMGCQKAITQEIIAAQADYVLNLKSNHPYLHRQVASWFRKSQDNGFAEQAHGYCAQYADGNNHGRIESREHWLIEVPEHLTRATKYWAKLQTIAMVRRTRQVDGKTSEETHYYISSLPLSAGAKTVRRPRGTQPLGGGERVALVAGRELWRGCIPSSQR
ncbi:MAG: ISAs1 family transposase [Polaromonas sp.]